MVRRGALSAGVRHAGIPWVTTPGHSGKGFFVSSSKLQDYMASLLIEHLPNATLYENHRPLWLMSPDGTRLELDFFIPTLRTAFEVQGGQHDQYVQHFHGSPEGYAAQLERDEAKRTICEASGIRLVEIRSEQEALLAVGEICDEAIADAYPPLVAKAMAFFWSAGAPQRDHNGQWVFGKWRRVALAEGFRFLGLQAKDHG